MGNIYFVRHGQTNRNAENKMNPGDVDSALNENGINQAIDAGKKAKNEGIFFDVIISSPLKRALETAELIAKETGYKNEIKTDERLIEQYAGVLKDYNHEKIKNEFKVKTNEEIRRIFKNVKYNKKEDILEFKNRVTQFYKDIKKQEQQNILIVSHSGVSRIIFMNSENIDFEEAVYKMDSVPNAKIIKLS